MSEKTGKTKRRSHGGTQTHAGTRTGRIARKERTEEPPEAPIDFGDLDLDAPLEPAFEFPLAGESAPAPNPLAAEDPAEAAPREQTQAPGAEASLPQIDLSPLAAPDPDAADPPGGDPVYEIDDTDGITGLNLNIQIRPETRPPEPTPRRPEEEEISRLANRTELSDDQSEVLKKYISLKEAEARDIKEQQRQYQAFLKKLSFQLEAQTKKNRDLLGQLETIKRREDTLKDELRLLKEKHQGDMLTLKNDYEERLRQSGNYESQIEDLMKKREEWREKVRDDLKRIKLKERELENKYELLKRDTQALLDSKDKHVLELKKKNDALELELETLEERLRKSNTVLNSIDAKKRRLIETFKLAVSLLEEIDRADASGDERPVKKAG